MARGWKSDVGERGEGAEGLFEQFAGSLLTAPVADIGEIKFALLNGEHRTGVVEILGAALALGPVQFGDHEILGRADDGFSAIERDAFAAGESESIVGIVAEKEKVDIEIRLGMVDEVAGAERDRFETDLRIDDEIRAEGLPKGGEIEFGNLKHEVGVIGGAIDAIVNAGKSADGHVGNGGALEGGGDGKDDLFSGHSGWSSK